MLVLDEKGNHIGTLLFYPRFQVFEDLVNQKTAIRYRDGYEWTEWKEVLSQ